MVGAPVDVEADEAYLGLSLDFSTDNLNALTSCQLALLDLKHALFPDEVPHPKTLVKAQRLWLQRFGAVLERNPAAIQPWQPPERHHCLSLDFVIQDPATLSSAQLLAARFIDGVSADLLDDVRDELLARRRKAKLDAQRATRGNLPIKAVPDPFVPAPPPADAPCVGPLKDPVQGHVTRAQDLSNLSAISTRELSSTDDEDGIEIDVLGAPPIPTQDSVTRQKITASLPLCEQDEPMASAPEQVARGQTLPAAIDKPLTSSIPLSRPPMQRPPSPSIKRPRSPQTPPLPERGRGRTLSPMRGRLPLPPRLRSPPISRWPPWSPSQRRSPSPRQRSLRPLPRRRPLSPPRWRSPSPPPLHWRRSPSPPPLHRRRSPSLPPPPPPPVRHHSSKLFASHPLPARPSLPYASPPTPPAKPIASLPARTTVPAIAEKKPLPQQPPPACSVVPPLTFKWDKPEGPYKSWPLDARIRAIRDNLSVARANMRAQQTRHGSASADTVDKIKALEDELYHVRRLMEQQNCPKGPVKRSRDDRFPSPPPTAPHNKKTKTQTASAFEGRAAATMSQVAATNVEPPTSSNALVQLYQIAGAAPSTAPTRPTFGASSSQATSKTQVQTTEANQPPVVGDPATTDAPAPAHLLGKRRQPYLKASQIPLISQFLPELYPMFILGPPRVTWEEMYQFFTRSRGNVIEPVCITLQPRSAISSQGTPCLAWFKTEAEQEESIKVHDKKHVPSHPGRPVLARIATRNYAPAVVEEEICPGQKTWFRAWLSIRENKPLPAALLADKQLPPGPAPQNFKTSSIPASFKSKGTVGAPKDQAFAKSRTPSAPPDFAFHFPPTKNGAVASAPTEATAGGSFSSKTQTNKHAQPRVNGNSATTLQTPTAPASANLRRSPRPVTPLASRLDPLPQEPSLLDRVIPSGPKGLRKSPPAENHPLARAASVKKRKTPPPVSGSIFDRLGGHPDSLPNPPAVHRAQSPPAPTEEPLSLTARMGLDQPGLRQRVSPWY